MTRTVWLASYPKSGNTWFRIFIANLLYPDQAPVDINRLPLTTPIASSRTHFDDFLGTPSALFTPHEVTRLRPCADEKINRTWGHRLLLRKAHDAYTWLGDGRPLLGQSPNFAALYILRDPWDVAVSLSNHLSCTPDQAVQHLGNPLFTLSDTPASLRSQFPQRLLTWEGHVRSWLEAPLALHLLRYEEMRRDPLPAFRGAVRFLGLQHDDQAITTALDACRFERLKNQEQEQRFRETPRKTSRFFRSGKVGEGLEQLSAEQRASLAAIKQRVDQAITEREQAR